MIPRTTPLRAKRGETARAARFHLTLLLTRRVTRGELWPTARAAPRLARRYFACARPSECPTRPQTGGVSCTALVSSPTSPACPACIIVCPTTGLSPAACVGARFAAAPSEVAPPPPPFPSQAPSRGGGSPPERAHCAAAASPLPQRGAFEAACNWPRGELPLPRESARSMRRTRDRNQGLRRSVRAHRPAPPSSRRTGSLRVRARHAHKKTKAPPKLAFAALTRAPPPLHTPSPITRRIKTTRGAPPPPHSARRAQGAASVHASPFPSLPTPPASAFCLPPAIARHGGAPRGPKSFERPRARA